MSTSLVYKSLELLETDLKSSQKNEGKLVRSKTIFEKNASKSKKKKIEIVENRKKLNILEVKKRLNNAKNVEKEQKRVKRKIKEICQIELEKNTIEKILERALTRRPVKVAKKAKKVKTTAFTEEDFAKFEREYQES